MASRRGRVDVRGVRRRAAVAFREHLRSLIDPDTDQIRLYPLTTTGLAQRLISTETVLSKNASTTG
ncbi:hypothetical protein GCM10027589_00200 [Actinocorallia lasiicapitis]